MYDLFLLIHKKNPMHLILKKHCKKKSLVFNAKFPPCQIHSPIYVRWECRWAYSSKLSTWFHASFTRNTPHNFMVCAWPNVSFPKFQHTYISQSKIPFFLLACLFQKYGATFEAYISSSTNPEIVRGRSHLELHINDVVLLKEMGLWFLSFFFWSEWYLFMESGNYFFLSLGAI